MIVTETTHHILDDKLVASIRPEALLTGLRAVVANRMADSGAAWAAAFERLNSGTQNNQWIVLDEKAVGRNGAAGMLTVLEQVPGKT